MSARWSIEGGIATITIDRPERLNAIDTATARALATAARAVTRAAGVRAIVLRGAGRAFAAGGDVTEFAADPTAAADVIDAILDAAHAAVLALHHHDAPVIAAVQGVAAGAGFSLVLGADLVVAAEGARFLCAYDRIGAPPDCGMTWFLPRKVGPAKAAELMYLSAELTAAEAQAAGIVNRVVAAEALEAEVAALAARVAAGPTRAFGAFKRGLAFAATATLEATLEAERRAFAATTRTADFAEGTGAFLARRKAAFRGD
jgi:2-(1,2-epoxy-1,2-dihydrophenyl)acetyl-CoA isomerase